MTGVGHSYVPAQTGREDNAGLWQTNDFIASTANLFNPLYLLAFPCVIALYAIPVGNYFGKKHDEIESNEMVDRLPYQCCRDRLKRKPSKHNGKEKKKKKSLIGRFMKKKKKKKKKSLIGRFMTATSSRERVNQEDFQWGSCKAVTILSIPVAFLSVWIMLSVYIYRCEHIRY